MTKALQQRARDEQINRAIHEQVMGGCWHKASIIAKYSDSGAFQDYYPYCEICDKWRNDNPSYTTDLNAVALAEAKVIEMKGAIPLSVCIAMQLEDERAITTFATARQRAEAVLKCMEIEL